MATKKKAAPATEQFISVEFMRNCEVKNHLGEIEFKAKTGDKMKLNPASAKRWISRGVAKALDK